MTDDEKLVAEQLETFGVMKFPPNFMDIGEKRFHWVFENRPEWVKFTKQWEKADGLFKFWYLYVKLRCSIDKKENESPEGTNKPVYTIQLDQ